jgi:hypothetical protein
MREFLISRPRLACRCSNVSRCYRDPNVTDDRRNVAGGGGREPKVTGDGRRVEAAPPLAPEILRANPRRSERIGAGSGVSNCGGHP